MQILETALKKIKPTPKEDEKIKKFVSDTLRVAKTISGLDAVVVGSIGKFTWLSGDHDIDIFLIFPKNTSREQLQEKGLEYGKKIVENLGGTSRIKYAEHPYTHAVVRGFHIDIVPCYKIEKGEHIVSAVDRSPLHLTYVLEHLSPRMQDEVRLLKQFCKANGVYGSDAKHQGFSGYICELIILYYQSFENAVKSACSWSAPQVIDLLGFTERAKFPDQPLIIIDPVDKDRNAAAAINGDNFIKFIASCKQFMAKPSTNFFNIQPIAPMNAKQIKYLSQRGTRFIAVKMTAPDVVDDVLYPQVRKAAKRIFNLLHHNEFAVLRSNEFVSGKTIYIIYELENFQQPFVAKMEGPPIFSKSHTEEFLSKYRGKSFLYLSGNRWIAEIKRDFRTPAELLLFFLHREKQKLIDDGIPSYIAESASKCAILEQEKFFSATKSDRDLSDFLREKYFVDFGRKM